MKPPLRIAILECDTPLERTKAKYGGYGGLFKALLHAGADSLNQPDVLSSKRGLHITTWDVVTQQAYPRLDDIDAVLLTGSRHSAFDDTPWILRLLAFVQALLREQHRVRLIGVCFGHQIVGRAMGARVARSEDGWEVAVTGVQLTGRGRELFGRESLNLHQMHRDVVCVCPEGVEELGSSAGCEVQGMYVRGRMVSVQGHPEFDEEVVRELVEARHAQGIFGDAVYGDAMARVGRRHDGVVVAAAFLRFLLEE